MPTVSEVEAYIRQAAMRRGIDPDIAVRVAKSEGLAPGVWQSNLYRNGVRERSYGPFQLYMGGGLGNEFERLTGKSAADPSTVFQQVDFALNQAARGGWSPFHGARRVGIGDRDGLRGAQTAPMMLDWSPNAVAFMKNNPQPGGYGPGMPDAENESRYRGSMLGPVTAPAPNTTPTRALAPSGRAAAAPVEPQEPSGKGRSWADRLADAGEAFDQAANEHPAPRINNPFGGDARPTGNQLLQLLQDPREIAKALLARRIG